MTLLLRLAILFICFPRELLAATDVLAALRADVAKKLEAKVISTSDPSWRRLLPPPPEISFEEDRAEYVWVLQTSEGELQFRLMPDKAPRMVLNIFYLTELGFFEGLLFHRAVPDVLLHSGCPLSRGFANPGYSLAKEPQAGLRFDRPGLLAAVPQKDDTNHGSQFFISLSPRPDWNTNHTLFGELVAGKEVLAKLAASANPDPRADGIPTLKILQITKARIVRTPAP